MSVLPPPAVQSRWARRWLSPDSETRAAAPPVHRLPQMSSSSVSDYTLRHSSIHSDMILRAQLAAAARSRSLLVTHGVGRSCSPADVPSEPPRVSSKTDHPVWAADRKLVSSGPPPTRSSQQRSHTTLTTPVPAPYRTTVSPSDPWIGYTTRPRDVDATTNAAMPQKWKSLEMPRSSFAGQALPPPYPADRAARSSSEVARASLHRRYISPAPPPPDFQAASSRSVSCLPPPSAVCTPDMAAAAHRRRTDARRGDAARRSLTVLPHSPLWTPVRDSATHSRQHRNTTASARHPPALNERIGRSELWNRRRLSGPLSVTIPRFEL